MADDQVFKEALDAIQKGQHERARDLLTRLLRTDQQNAQYWVYLSTVVDTDKERLYCLENALRLDPKNSAAQRGMVILGYRDPAPDLTIVRPTRTREWNIGEILSASGEIRQSNKPESKAPWAAFLGVVLLFGFGLTLTSFGIIGNPLYKAPPATQASAGIALTPAAFFTAGPSPTALNGVDGGIEIADNGATVTPTALYVNTPHPSNDDFRLAMDAIADEDWEAAKTYIEKFLEVEPTLDARYYQGVIYYHLEDYWEAANRFTQVIDLEETFGPAYLWRAKTFLALEVNNEVAENLNKALVYSPEIAETYFVRADYRISRNNLTGALEDMNAVLQFEPNNAAAYAKIAEVQIRLEEYDLALEAAQMAYNLDPRVVENYFILGKSLVLTDAPDSALSPLQAYVSVVVDNPEAWLYLAQAQVATQDYQNAIDSLTGALLMNDKLYEAHYYLAVSYQMLGDFESAYEQYETAARIFPKWFEPQLGLGQILYLTGEGGEAFLQIHKNASLATTDESRAALYYWRALAQESIDNQVEADKDWNRLLALPSNAVPGPWRQQAQNHLAGVYSPTPTMPSSDSP